MSATGSPGGVIVHVELTEAPAGTRASGGTASGSSGSAKVVGASAGSCRSSTGRGTGLGEGERLGGSVGLGLKVGVMEGLLELTVVPFPEHAEVTRASTETARSEGRRRTSAMLPAPSSPPATVASPGEHGG